MYENHRSEGEKGGKKKEMVVVIRGKGETTVLKMVGTFCFVLPVSFLSLLWEYIF